MVGILISIALLWWALHDIDLAQLWAELRSMSVGPFLAMLVFATLAFPLRTVRWRYLLRAEGVSLPWVPLWHATAIGFMANNLLPARAGEVARAYAARRLTDVRFTTAFASIAVERVMDGLTLVTLLVIGAWAGGFSAETVVGGVTLGGIVRGAGAIFTLLLLLAFALVHWPERALTVARGVTSTILPHRWTERFQTVLEGMIAGLEALRSPKSFAIITFWSFVMWLVATASYLVGFFAFHIDAPWTAALVLQGLVAFGVAVPSSPGFFGVIEVVVIGSLALYGIGKGPAVSYAVGYHIGTFIPITLLGIWSLGRTRMGFGEIRRHGEPES